MRLDYPDTPRGDVEDDYHGHRVDDPYRWMEALEAPEIKAWIDAQNRVTSRYLDSLPLREQFRTRITELWNYPKRRCRSSKAAGSSTRRTRVCRSRRVV